MRIANAARSIFLCASCALLLAACSDDSTTGPSTQTTSELITGSEVLELTNDKVSVAGRITDTEGNALSNVKVSASGYEIQSDENGFFELIDVQIPVTYNMVVQYDKPGFISTQKIVAVVKDLDFDFSVKLSKHQHSEIIDPNAASTNVVSAQDPNDGTSNVLAEISFPPGSITSEAPVSVNVYVGNPGSDAGKTAFPGDYMATNDRTQPSDILLESVVFTDITLQDDMGNDITTLDQPATVKLRIPDADQSKYTLGQTIPWWSYSETKATWVREDADPSTPTIDDAIIVQGADGALYAQAMITHFSWWNVDAPITEHSCMCVDVQDGDTNPVSWVNVEAEGKTYNGRSRPTTTNAQGRACVTVKRTKDVSKPEKVALKAWIGEIDNQYDVTEDVEGNIITEELNSNVERGSTIDGSYLENPAVCLFLKNKIDIATGTIQGTVTDSSDNPIPGLTMRSTAGSKAVTNSSGEYSLSVPLDKAVSVYAFELAAQDAMVIDKNTPVILNFSVPNKPPKVRSSVRSKYGPIGHNETMTISIEAVDPERQALTIAWSSSDGIPLDTSADPWSANFTSPGTGTGSTEIIALVTDVKGAQVSRSFNVIWGRTYSGTHLKLKLLHSGNRVETRPTPVVLYKQDNKTVESILYSDANGIVDFGDIGRTHATILISRSWSDTRRNLIMLMDVPVIDGEFHFHQSNLWANSSVMAGSSCSTNSSINVNVSGLPGVGAGYEQFLSLSPGRTVLFAPSLTSQTSVSTTDLECNSPHHAAFYEYRPTGSTEDYQYQYGFAMDLGNLSGASYSLALAHEPNMKKISYYPQLSESVSYYRTKALWEGKGYNLPGLWHGNPTTNMIPIPDRLPMTEYIISATMKLSTTGVSRYSEKSFKAPPVNDIVLKTLDAEIGNLVFDSVNSSLSWDIANGKAPVDISIAELSYPKTFNIDGTLVSGSVNWTVWQHSEQTTWVIPDIPPELSEIIDKASLDQTTLDLSVQLRDYDIYDNMEDIWYAISNGVNPYEVLGYMRSAKHQIRITP
ncbi:MAG: carboxypeptidase-like regulatory domain-containing protein [Gammaproteobacteria bacterium]|nr:carboxypeptidase-like regulatory domain-containing protein [Gammaproteobacteria bacterium]